MAAITDKAADERTSRVKPENFVLVQGWMLTELHLSGNDLLIYAIIYGFCQDGENWFRGSLRYLADWTGSTRRGAMKNLSRLMDKGLIVRGRKTEAGIFEYRTTRPAGSEHSSPVNKVHQGGEQSSPGGVNIVHQGGEHSSPNNIEEKTIKDTIEDNTNVDLPFPVSDEIDDTPDESTIQGIKIVVDAWNKMIAQVKADGVQVSSAQMSSIVPGKGNGRYELLVPLLEKYSPEVMARCLDAYPQTDWWMGRGSNPKFAGNVKNFDWMLQYWDKHVITRADALQLIKLIPDDGDGHYIVVETQPPAPAATADAEEINIGLF